MHHFSAKRDRLSVCGPSRRASRGGYAGAVIASMSMALVLGAPLAPAQAATPGFAGKADYATGTTPQSVAVADLGNGKQDLVVANKGSNTVSVLLGKGNGTYEKKVDYPTGEAPTAVAVADLGNGKQDIVVANSGSNNVSVLLGNGDGTFKPQAEYETGKVPTAVAIANLGTGQQDLVVANTGSNTVSVLLGKGDGTFEPKADYPTGEAPSAVAVADLNGDKNPDIVVANSGSNSVSVLLGGGGGTFAGQVEYETGKAPTAVAIGALGTVQQDVVVANKGSNTVSVLLGKGDGTFEKKVDYETGTASAAVAIANLGNGEPDLVVANSTANTVSVLLGKVGGTFAAKRDLGTGKGPQSVAIGDLNGDGTLDLVVADAEANTVSVLLSVPTVETSAITPFAGQLFGTKSAAQTVTVTNGGAAPLTVSSLAAAGNFSASGCKTTVAAGQKCAISVVFGPKGYGTLKGTLTITSNAPGSPKTIGLSGTGLPPTAVVTTRPVEEVFGSYVTLTGTVLSQGPGSFYFQYGTTSAYGSVTPTLPLASSNSSQLFASTVALQPGVTYHYRIVASNLVGTVAGADQSFTLPPDEPFLARRHGRLHLASVLRGGLPLRVGDPSAATITITVYVDAKTAHLAHLASPRQKSKAHVAIGRLTVKVRGAATKAVLVKIQAKLRRRLAALGQLKLLIKATGSTSDGAVGSPTQISLNLQR
jgi:hypothetical protein